MFVLDGRIASGIFSLSTERVTAVPGPRKSALGDQDAFVEFPLLPFECGLTYPCEPGGSPTDKGAVFQ
jgi:hypothetical protein